MLAGVFDMRDDAALMRVLRARAHAIVNGDTPAVLRKLDRRFVVNGLRMQIRMQRVSRYALHAVRDRHRADVLRLAAVSGDVEPKLTVLDYAGCDFDWLVHVMLPSVVRR